ncbi:MAG: ribonuclease T2 family protein [Methyloceanibacter sp.]|uniref:ribonuclease T2 family protein n=1 Tax=Methyloceanibacter sp. TaxID=1965321 RepID=UPI003D6D4A7E
MPGLERIVSVFLVIAALTVAASTVAFGRDRPGVFDYYVLVLGWSPTYCILDGFNRRDRQCEAGHDFVLHGLWPQHDNGWPEDCYTGKRPWIPREVIDRMRDIMPSMGLIIHEYSTHGTCSGLSLEQYYDAARALYERIVVPPQFDDPEAQRHLSPDEIEREFIAVNPWLQADMIAVTCRRDNLLDIRVCFDRALRPRPCGVNEDQARLCRANTISVPAP